MAHRRQRRHSGRDRIVVGSKPLARNAEVHPVHRQYPIARSLGVAFLLALLGACSGEQPPADSVFEAQTEAIGKAEDAARALEDAAASQRRAIDQQSQ